MALGAQFIFNPSSISKRANPRHSPPFFKPTKTHLTKQTLGFSTTTSTPVSALLSERTEPIKLTYLEGNSWLWDLEGVNILVDPILVGNLDFGIPWLYDAAKKVLTNFRLEDLPELDCLVITQSLDDHCHVKTLRPLSEKVPNLRVISTPNAESKLSWLFRNGRFRFLWCPDDNDDPDQLDNKVVQEIVLKYIDNSWRDHKHHTYRKLQEAPTDEMKEAVKPSNWSPRYWAAMIEHYSSREYQEKSERGQIAQVCCGDVYRGGGRGASERGYRYVTYLEPSQSSEVEGKNGSKVNITATAGPVLGPPWQRPENGYIVTCKQSPLSLYYEPHCVYNQSSLQNYQADVIITPVIKQLLPGFTLVSGQEDAVNLAKLLQAKYVVPMKNGDLDAKGILASIVNGEGTVESFEELLRKELPGAIVLEPKPGEPLGISTSNVP